MRILYWLFVRVIGYPRLGAGSPLKSSLPHRREITAIATIGPTR